MLNWLCKLNIHAYKDKGMPTKANAIGGYIWKQRQVCSRCGATRLVVSKRLSPTKIHKKA